MPSLPLLIGLGVFVVGVVLAVALARVAGRGDSVIDRDHRKSQAAFRRLHENGSMRKPR